MNGTRPILPKGQSIQIYILLTGQEDNIGDVVLRRAMLDALRPYGQLHVFLRGTSDEFRDALGLTSDDLAYDVLADWRRDALRAALRRRTWFVDKPGELLMTLGSLRWQVGLLPIIFLVKLRGGLVLRLGIGQRYPNRRLGRWFRLLYLLSTSLAWRDTGTRDTFGIGRIMPDWAFYDDLRSQNDDVGPRDRLVLSYRSDRPVLSPPSLDALSRYARESGLKLTVVTQVRRDDSRSRDLADALGADLVDWPAERTHRDQERRLRSIYGTAALVVSDRLHVLIVGMLEGGAPACVVEYPEIKIARHLEVVGIDDVVFDARGASTDALLSQLGASAARLPTINADVENARRAVEVELDALDSRRDRSRGVDS